MEFARVLEQHQAMLDAFSKGDSGPAKALYSEREDVTLANPFGPPAHARKAVEQALDRAASQFREGESVTVEFIAEYSTPELITTFAMERWRSKVGGAAEITPFDLRVTSVFRLEAGEWKLVHRHADPLTTFDPRGPLRTTG